MDDLAKARRALRSTVAAKRARGVRIIEDLSDKGDRIATYALASWYLNGANGYPQDLDRARRLLDIAAEELVPEALYDLGELIETTSTCKGNRKIAFGYYVLSAILGDIDAIEEVSRCFFWGIGTFKNREAADRLLDVLENRRTRRDTPKGASAVPSKGG